MSFNLARYHWIRSVLLLASGVLLSLLLAACGPETPANPGDLLLSPGDVSGIQLTVISQSQEQSGEGPSALVELQGPGFRVLQSVVLFESRELSLAALDGIRGDLSSQGEAGPGGVETSGVLEHSLGQDEASSVFFIEDRALVRLTVTGPERLQRLEELAAIARNKLEGG